MRAFFDVRSMVRTVEWDSKHCEVHMIDQRLLPGRFEVAVYTDPAAVADAIRDMVVRGAPAIGVSAAFGLALAACRSKADNVEALRADLQQAGSVLNAARPTAVNLSWAVKRILAIAAEPMRTASELRERISAAAQQMADEDVLINKRMAAHGATLIDDGDTIIHHCNTGSLATVDWGTALGVIRAAHESGKKIHVLVDETRPRLQGARLTAWELSQYGIPYEIISDNAAGYFLRSGQVQKVFFGADRVAANGDVVNKVGSYMLALAAHTNSVPVYSVFPLSTVDLTLAHGDLIPIEEREPGEVLDIQVHGQPVTPEGAKARNPAFDITPHEYLSGLVTEEGVIEPPFIENLSKAVNGAGLAKTSSAANNAG
jgi:methylthioribose-1-phosphate isomerase